MYISKETFFSLGGPTLAKKLDTKEDFQKLSYPIVAQPKYDGVRATYFPVENELYTRNNNKIVSCPELLQTLSELKLPFPVDGELLVKGMSFNDASGVVRRTTNISEESDKIYFVMFDAVTDGGIKDRISKLISVCNKAKINVPILTAKEPIFQNLKLFISDTITKFTPNAVEKQFEFFLLNDYEGIILRNPTARYEFKRTNNLRKLKKIIVDTADVVGFQSGKGRLTHTLGFIELKYKNKYFTVGSGLSDSLRDELWKRGVKPGDTVTFSYQELSKDFIPRFPVFIKFNSEE